MITSIVHLPEFAPPGTVLRGSKYGGLYPPEFVNDIQFIQVSGRDLPIDHNLYKYKLRVTEQYGRMFDVVMATTGPIVGTGLVSVDPSTVVYPLYLREVICNGYNSHYISSVILNTEGISRLLTERLGIQGVTTITSIMEHGIQRYVSDIDHIPTEILEHNCDPRLATLVPMRNTFMENFVRGGSTAGDMLRDIVSLACVPYGYVGAETSVVINARVLQDILGLIDPYHSRSMIELMISSVDRDYSSYFSLINTKHPPYEQVYMHSDQTGDIDKLLYVSTMFGSADFTIEFQDLYNPKDMLSWKKFDVAKSDTETICKSTSYITWEFRESLINHIQHPLGEYAKVVGSYLEDMWVYDRQGELIAYFDLVWWFLTAGAGLINISSAYIQ